MRLILFAFSILGLVNIAGAASVHVVLDPGHGGPTEWGYTAAGFDEKTINLQIAKKTQALLEAEDKYEVVLSRIGDYPVTLNDRRKTANQYEDSVFVSIHSTTYDKEPKVIAYALKQVNTIQNSVLTPIEFVHGKESKNSLKFAQMVREEIPENMNPEVVLPKFPIASLIGIQSPAIVVECHCVSGNAQSTEANLDEFSRNLAEGIEAFIRKVL